MKRSVTLDPEQSVALREKLLAELANITSADLAAAWAREALTAKNSLTAADAKLVEDAFERRLSELPSSETAAPSDDDASGIQVAGPQETVTTENTDPAKGIDKSVLTVAVPRVAIATESTFDISPNNRASCAAASPPIRIIFDSCNHERSDVRQAMNSRCHSAACTTGRCIALVTSVHGGSRPASTRSRSPASSGSTRA